MKSYISLVLLLASNTLLLAQTKTIHVFVALCDNEHQGIVPVPENIGNGKKPSSNLYWGAGYGVKSFFKHKTSDWKFVKSIESNSPYILERVLFQHTKNDVYILADAYDGEQIKPCIEDFLVASNGQNKEEVIHNNQAILFGGSANLLAYIGHDGLMEFEVNPSFKPTQEPPKDVVILACYSKHYFSTHVKSAGANPLLWTTHLMAPEAYTLKAEIDERAAQEYNKYQKCGIKGARNLFTTGF